MAWNDLSVAQRSRLMGIFRRNGVTSLSEMRRIYDTDNPMPSNGDQANIPAKGEANFYGIGSWLKGKFRKNNGTIDPEPPYYGGTLDASVVTASLPRKFHGSQAAAKRYAEAERWAKENVADPRDAATPYILIEWKHATGGPLQDKDQIQILVDRINATSDADFVSRLKDPNRQVLHGKDGEVMTHLLSYVEEDGDAVIYPEIQRINGKLRKFHNWRKAYESAVNRGDTVRTSIPLAELFTKTYKNYYPGFNKYALGGGRRRDRRVGTGIHRFDTISGICR